MSKLVNWGRWLIALFFTFQGLTILVGIEAIVVFLAVKGERELFYPAFMALIAGLPLLVCAWGLLRVRGWGYGLAIAISILEGITGTLIYGIAGVKQRSAWFAFEGTAFSIDRTGVFSLLLGWLILAWLLLPAVRAQFLNKGVAA